MGVKKCFISSINLRNKGFINFVINNSYLFENKYVCSANAFGRGVTLNDYIERIKKKQNLYYEVNFKNEDIHIEILDEAKSDFNFLINNI